MREATTRLKEILARIDPADLIVEVISVLLAILLAFAVNRWQEERRTHRETAIAIANIRDEIAANDRLLESHRRQHEATLVGYRRLTSAAHAVSLADFYGTFGRLDPHGFEPFFGESFAWDIARSSPAIVAIPYATRVALERTYAEQSRLDGFGTSVVADLHVASTDRTPDFLLAAISLTLDAADIVAAEDRLHALYRADLAALR